MTIQEVWNLIEIQKNKALPFVAYRMAGECQLHVLAQQDQELHSIEKTTLISGFVFAPFDADKHKTVVIPEANSKRYTCSLEELPDFSTRAKEYPNTHRKEDKERHISLVQNAIRAIEMTSCEKIVVSRQEHVQNNSSDSLILLQRLLYAYPNAYVYCWYHPKVGMWLGATPETLLSVQKGNYKTMALAGTQPYAGQKLNHTNWGQKEVVEQRMVTDYIVNSLQKILPKVVVSDTYTHKAGTVVHLRTDITGTLSKEVSLHQIINVLHPTPAVCGLPKTEAKTFLNTAEGYDRKYYTGFLGMIHNDKKDGVTATLVVNLRCMEITDTDAILYIGGGITKDSVAEKEWEETVRKSETIKRVLMF